MTFVVGLLTVTRNIAARSNLEAKLANLDSMKKALGDQTMRAIQEQRWDVAEQLRQREVLIDAEINKTQLLVEAIKAENEQFQKYTKDGLDVFKNAYA